MRVSKWGNSLAVRIPAEIVEELGLKEGDEMEISAKQPDLMECKKQMTMEERWEWLRAQGKLLPADYEFSRTDAYEGTGRY